MKRRDFLKTLPIGVAALGIPFSAGGFAGRAYGRNPVLDALLNGTDQSDRVLVLINLQGGNDGLNTVIPFTDPLYATQRKSIGFVTTDQKSQLSSRLLSTSHSRLDLALNPVMDSRANGLPSFYEMFKAGKVAVVNNVGYPDPSRSHFRSTDIWNTATDSNVVMTTGWLGRWLEAQNPNYPQEVTRGDDPIAVSIGGALNPVFQGSKSGMGVAVIDPSHYYASAAPIDEQIPETSAGAELSYVRNIFLQSDIYGDRFNALFSSKPTNKVAYPTTNGQLTSIASQLQKVAWCISKGMKTKVYFVQLGGFDTHISQNSADPAQTGQGMLLKQLGEAIAAFQADMEAFGCADRVIGMTYSEFGRRVNENDSAGTDHGTCAPQFLFGSQINGEVYGANPNLNDLDANLDLKWQVDFRQLYTGVLGDWFGASEALRKAILLDPNSNQKFAWDVAVNGTSTIQSLIRTPFNDVRPSNERSEIILYPAYPNPFYSASTIRFALPRTMQVKLEVFDQRGTKVAGLVDGSLARGDHQFNFDASRFASGTYLYRLEADGETKLGRMELTK